MTALETLTTPQNIADPHFQPLDFIEVPEVTPDQLPDIVNGIDLRRANRKLPSYGAYVLRQASVADVTYSLQLLQRMYGPKLKLRRQKLPEEKDRAIHSDPGFSFANDVTAHYTKTGQAEMLILAESRLKIALRAQTMKDEEDMTSQLFDHRLLNTSRASLPKIAMRTLLNPTDLLIFDHTQPHLFRSVGDSRISWAYFFFEGPVRKKIKPHMVTLPALDE